MDCRHLLASLKPKQEGSPLYHNLELRHFAIVGNFNCKAESLVVTSPAARSSHNWVFMQRRLSQLISTAGSHFSISSLCAQVCVRYGSKTSETHIMVSGCSHSHTIDMSGQKMPACNICETRALLHRIAPGPACHPDPS